MLVLKRLADAERDRIYGTLLGAHVSNSGTGLLLKPHMESELDCLRDTYTKFGVEPESLYSSATPPARRRGHGRAAGHPRHLRQGEDPAARLDQGQLRTCGRRLRRLRQAATLDGARPDPRHPKLTQSSTATSARRAVRGRRRAMGCPGGLGFGANAHAVFEVRAADARRRRGCARRGRRSPSWAWRRTSVRSRRCASTRRPSGGDGVRNRPRGGASCSRTSSSVRRCTCPTRRSRARVSSPVRGALYLPCISPTSPLYHPYISPVSRQVRGAFIEAIDVDHGWLRLPMLPEDQLQPQQLLALTVIDRAAGLGC